MRIITPEELAQKYPSFVPPSEDLPKGAKVGQADFAGPASTSAVNMTEREYNSFFERGINIDPSAMNVAYAQRAAAQSGLDRFGNAVVGGLVGAMGVMLENASYMTLQPAGQALTLLDDWEQNSLAQLGQKIKESRRELFPIYKADQNEVWNKWDVLGDLIENGLGFAVPGLGVAKAIPYLTRAAAVTKYGKFLQGAIGRSLDFALPGLISNFAEGTMMGFETYNSLVEQGYSKDEASEAADKVRLYNAGMVMADMIQLHGIYKGTKALRNTQKNPLLWRENLKKSFTTFSAENPVLQSFIEGGEEIYQGIVQREAEFDIKSRYGAEEYNLYGKNILGRLGEYAKDESLWYEGALGFISGGAQHVLMKEGGNYFDRRKYNKLQEEISSWKSQLETATDEDKSFIESRIKDLEAEAENSTRVGLYNAQQKIIENFKVIFEKKLKDTAADGAVLEKLINEGRVEEADLLKDWIFDKLAFQHMQLGTLDSLERFLKGQLEEKQSEETDEAKEYPANHRQNVQKRLDRLKQLEKNYLDSTTFANPAEIYFAKSTVDLKQKGLDTLINAADQILNGPLNENGKNDTAKGLNALAEKIALAEGSSEYSLDKHLKNELKLSDIENEAERERVKKVKESVEELQAFKKLKELHRGIKQGKDEVVAANQIYEKYISPEYQQKVKDRIKENEKNRKEQKEAALQKAQNAAKRNQRTTENSEGEETEGRELTLDFLASMPLPEEEEVTEETETAGKEGIKSTTDWESIVQKSVDGTYEKEEAEKLRKQEEDAKQKAFKEKVRANIRKNFTSLKNKYLQKIKDERKRKLKELTETTLNQLNGQTVIYKGAPVKVDINESRILLIGESIEYEFDVKDGTKNIIYLRISLIPIAKKKYNVEAINEEFVIVNNIRYRIVNDEVTGNVIQLIPVNEMNEQIGLTKITNESLLVAVEIERNKLSYNALKEVQEVNEENVSEIVDEEVKQIFDNYANALQAVEAIYLKNFNETIENALDKLYNEKPLSEFEKLSVDLWLSDAFSNMISQVRENPNNEIFSNALDNLEIISKLLYSENYERFKRKQSAEEPSAPKPSRKRVKKDTGKTKEKKERVTKTSKSKSSKKKDIVDAIDSVKKEAEVFDKVSEDLLQASEKGLNELDALYDSLPQDVKDIKQVSQFYNNLRQYLVESLTPESVEEETETTDEGPAVVEVVSTVNISEVVQNTMNNTSVDISMDNKKLEQLNNAESEQEESDRTKSKQEGEASYSVSVRQRDFTMVNGKPVDKTDTYDPNVDPETIWNTLDPSVTDGTELVFVVDTSVPITRGGPPFSDIEEQLLDEDFDNLHLYLPIAVYTKDGRKLGFIKSAKGKNASPTLAQLRLDIANKYLVNGEKNLGTGKISYKYEGVHFRLLQPMSAISAFPEELEITIVGLEGKLLGKTDVNIPENFRVPGAAFLITPYGKPIHLKSVNVNEEHVQAIAAAIEIYVSLIRGVTVDQLSQTNQELYNLLDKYGYDLGIFKDVERFVSQYIHLFNPDKQYQVTDNEKGLYTSNLAKYLDMVTVKGETKAFEKPLFNLVANGVNFIKSLNKDAAGRYGLSISKNTPAEVFDSKQWKEALVIMLRSAYYHVDSLNLDKEVLDVRIDNKGKVTSERKSYTKLVKENHKVMYKSTNLGTEEAPRRVYTVNPVIKFTVDETVEEKKPFLFDVTPAAAINIPSDIEVQRDDIERRRKEELNKFKFENKGQNKDDFKSEEAEVSFSINPDGTYSVMVSLKADTSTGYLYNNILSDTKLPTREDALERLKMVLDKINEKINAKYNAELAALEQGTPTVKEVQSIDAEITDYKVLETFLPTAFNLSYTIRIQNNKTGKKGSYTIDKTGRWIIAKFDDKTGDYEIVDKPLSQKQIINSAKAVFGENFVNKLNSIKSETDKVTEVKGGEKFEKFLELLEKYDAELTALKETTAAVPKLSTVKIDLSTLSLEELKNVAKQLRQKAVDARQAEKQGKIILGGSNFIESDYQAVKKYIAELEALETQQSEVTVQPTPQIAPEEDSPFNIEAFDDMSDDIILPSKSYDKGKAFGMMASLRNTLIKKGLINRFNAVIDPVGLQNYIGRYSDDLEKQIRNVLPLPVNYKLPRAVVMEGNKALFEKNVFHFYDLAMGRYTEQNEIILKQNPYILDEDFMKDYAQEYLRRTKLYKLNCR